MDGVSGEVLIGQLALVEAVNKQFQSPFQSAKLREKQRDLRPSQAR